MKALETSVSPYRMDFRQFWRAAAVVLAGVAAGMESAALSAPHQAEPEERAAASQPLGKLLYATPAQVRARFGDPDVSRSEGKGAFWTYRMPHCALFLFFQDGAKGLRVSGASTGPRKRGETAPTVDACLAQAIETPE